MVWTALMTVEFFAGEWLRARLFLYAVSHMLVMPLALLWVLAMAGEGTTGLPTWKALWLAALGFFFGFVFEVARKLRAPDDEREGIDSYSKVFGPSGAAGVLGFLLTLSMVSIGGLLHAATGSLELWWGLILAALAGLGWFAVVRFHRQPRRESAERLEKTVMLAGLSAFVVCDLILILERGVAWSV